MRVQPVDPRPTARPQVDRDARPRKTGFAVRASGLSEVVLHPTRRGATYRSFVSRRLQLLGRLMEGLGGTIGLISQ